MGFRQIFPTFLVFILALASVSAVGGQDNSRPADPPAADPLLEEAREQSAVGKLQDAAETYTKWLAENAGHDDFGMILIEAADSQLSVERALELLRVYTPRVQDPRQRELCRASQIDLLEMLGRTEQALGLLRSFPPVPRWLYRQGQLLYQEGLVEEAEKSLQQALKALLSEENGEIDKNNNELEARIRLLQARIFTVQERRKEAEKLFQLLAEKYGETAVGPGILLAYYEYLLDQARNEEAEKQLDRLAREFPDSPELALARADQGEVSIGYAPIPSRLLPRDLPLPRDRSGSDQGGERPGSIEERKQADEVKTAASTPVAEQPKAAEQEPVIPVAEPESTAPAPQPTARTGQPESRPIAQSQEPAEQPAVEEESAAEQPAAPSGQSVPQAEQPAATAQPSTPTEQPSTPTALVQTGSFRDRENAEYMVRDLETAGFKAGIVEKRIGGTLYYRVVIGPLMTVDQAQAVLMKLKDASFEGVLLFPE